MNTSAMKLQLTQAAGLIFRTLDQIEKAEPGPEVPPPNPVDPRPQPGTESLWEAFLRLVANSDLIPHDIKPAFVSQAIQETGRGTARLFLEFLNPAGMKFRPEMEEICEGVEIEVSSEPSGRGVFCKFSSLASGIAGYWRFVQRPPYAGFEAHLSDPVAYLRHIGPVWATDPDYTRSCIGLLPEARQLLAKYGWVGNTSLPLEGEAILLDAGHSRNAQGASSRDGRVSEYSMTSMMVAVMAERLRAVGAVPDLFDPNPDDLRAVGLRAKGKRVAIFNHLNAFDRDGVDNGTEAFVHPDASQQCRQLAKNIVGKVCEVLGTKNRGVKTAKYSVLAYSHTTDCDLNILVESFFLDDWTDAAQITDRCTKAAHAIADAIIDFLK